jgi:glycosyltransferase involved in cell wall biosynthesis
MNRQSSEIRPWRRRISIFVPAYNEAAHLEGAIADIAEAAEAALEDYEILLVDDGSTDGTAVLADHLAQQRPKLRVIHQPINRGIAAGYARAVEVARFESFGFLPSDREIDATSIKDILAAVGSAEIVVPYHGNPEARPPYRRLLTSTSTALVNRLFGLRVRYFQGPCVYPTELARALPKTAGGFYFVTQMLVHALCAGHSYVEVALFHQERAHGRSTAVSLRNIVKALRTIAALWWTVHIRDAGMKKEIS